MSNYELDKINAARRRRGRSPLTRAQAESTASAAPAGVDLNLYLITLATSTISEPSCPDTGSPSSQPDFTYGDSGSSSDTGGG